ncbi:MAG: CpaF family protein [Sulfurimonas sp.]|nr:CpaF family protein [Sulfurimonas sp.]MBU3939287.1 Flp pilus assembly complex ATPase component TadA [bacterium]MBU4024114.1 Flp pilus assembly complex ATPase component TadA [bacterium]MBU4058470.1 Flp pilus assembly complex ATPase component TadA [bacterium]
MALKDTIKRHQKIEGNTELKKESKVETGEHLCSDLCFPMLYKNDEYFNLAYRIYDDFLEKLNIQTKLTEKMVREVVVKHISMYSLPKLQLKNEIADFITDNLLYYGAISTITRIAGADLNDILVNTKDYIDVIYAGQTIATPFRFRSEEELRHVINRMLSESNRKIDEAHPIASAKLNDGSRIEVQIPPIAANLDKDGKAGSYITIRKFREIPLLFETLIDAQMIDMKMAYFLLMSIRGKLNIVVSGGTSSGKTTFLNSITRFIDEGDQLLTIEDTKEMKPQLPCHSIRSFEARPENEEGAGGITIDMLLKTALRSSPRRIVVGECRGVEIVTMLNAMNTGHPGSMTTIHADDTKEAIVRIENMFLEARPTANMSFVRTQIISAVDLVVQLVRFPDGRRRLVKISEPEKRIEEGGLVSMLDLFEFQRLSTNDNPMDSTGKFRAISTSTRAAAKMLQNGIILDKRIFDNDFLVTKDMLLDELKAFHPERMCGWRDNYLSEIIQNSYIDGKNIIERWPNLQK